MVAPLMLAGPASAETLDLRSDDWCQIVDAPARNTSQNVPRFGPGPKHRILYVNRFGGTYRNGADDSSQNISGVVADTGTIPPFAGTQADWDEIMTCVRRLYAPFAIEVTDVEPAADVEYVESVVGGLPSDIGLGNGIGGVAWAGPAGCNVIERGINYTFSELFGNGNNELICEIVAQESGHDYKLDHSLHCLDPMTYLPNCGQKRFLDQDVSCGESQPRGCNCGGTTQNTHQILLATFGPADDVPPQVSITEPADGATVTPGFSITATPTDDVRIDRVEFFVDGNPVGKRSAAPYTVTAPLDLAIGARLIEVRAVDGDENAATDSVDLSLVPECVNNTQCAENFECINDRCLGGVGEPCSLQGQCASDQCFFDPDTQDQFCTVSCTVGSNECPSGFACTDPGTFGTPKCLPSLAEEGCCSTTARSSGPAGSTVLLLGLSFFLASALRRRRRA